jgi:hypothetical protein
VLGQAVPIQPFERIHNSAVEGAPPLLQETPVRHLVGQGVLEGVFRLGEEAGLVEELGSLQTHEPTAERLVRHLGDGLKQGEGHLRADDRGGLQQALLLRRESVDAGGQDGLHGRWHLQRLQGLAHAIGPALPDQHPGLY